MYWMFYAAGDFEEVAAPAGIPSVQSGQAVEGLRCVTCKSSLHICTISCGQGRAHCFLVKFTVFLIVWTDSTIIVFLSRLTD